MAESILEVICDWFCSGCVEEIPTYGSKTAVAADFSGHLPALATSIWGQTELQSPGCFCNAVDQLLKLPPEEYSKLVDQVIERKLTGKPPAAKDLARTYLRQFPSQARCTLRRPADPGGASVPTHLRPRKPEDLLPFLPARLPRFQAGHRPLPGVDLELEQLLGVGGLGEVWKARNPHLASADPVALKFCLDPQAAVLLRHEAAVLDRVMRQGRHPGIVQLRHTYLSADPPCLEYEYVPGGDLGSFVQERYQSGKGLSGTQAARMVQRLAEIVGHAHSQRPPIVHRDLKPANVLVQQTAAGNFKLLVADFGIGGLAAGHARQATVAGVLLTSAVRGSYTPLYASPQQMRGEPPDPRDDVYSLGVLWLQLLTGDLTAESPGGTLWTRRQAEKQLPAGMIELLASCLEDVPGDRPGNAQELARQINQVLRAEAPAEVAPAGAGNALPVASPPQPQPPGPRAATSSPPATRTSEAWYYAKGGGRVGPVDFAALKRLAQAGEIIRGTLVCRQGANDWAPAERIDGLLPGPPKPAGSPPVRGAEERPAAGACPPGSLTPLELSWSLYDRVVWTFAKPVLDHLEQIKQASDLAAQVDARDPARYRQACGQGITAVTALGLGPGLPGPVRRALQRLGAQREQLLGHLDPAGLALRAAADEVRGLNLPQGMAGFFHGAAEAHNPATSAGKGAIGGALIGTVFGPWGAVVGSSLGAYFGRKHKESRDQAVLTRFDNACQQMVPAITELSAALWNAVARLTQEEGGPALQDAAFFETAGERLRSIRKRHESPLATLDAYCFELEGHLRDWGPDREALWPFVVAARVLARSKRDPELSRKADDYAAKHLALYPQDPNAHDNAAAGALARGDFGTALEFTSRGLRFDPASSSLLVKRLEAAAALGHRAEAESAFSLLTREDKGFVPWLARVRGQVRGDRLGEALDSVRKWLDAGGPPAAVARQLRQDDFIRGAAGRLIPQLPAFSQVPGGLEGELLGGLQTYLWDDGAKMHLGDVPPDKRAIVAAEYLKPRRGEKLLFLYDWSVWGSSKTGLAITTERVVWKCMWAEPVSMELDAVAPEQVVAEKTVLRVAGVTIDVEDETLALCLGAALRDMASVLKASTVIPA